MTDSMFAIRAVVITAETGSFSETGRRLGVGHSVVSKRIAQLEWELRRTLFSRSTRSVKLTEYGQQHLPNLCRIVKEFDLLVGGNVPHADDVVGHLSVKCPAYDSFALEDILADFIARHPALTVNTLFVDRIVNPVDESFDVVLTMMGTTFAGVVEVPLAPFDRLLCASPDYLARRGEPRTAQDLLGHDCIVYGPTGSRWPLRGPAGEATVEVHPHLVTNNGNFVRAMTLRGKGISVLQKPRVDADLAAGRIVRVLPDHHFAPLWLKALVPRHRLQARPVQVLLQHFRKALEGQVASGG